MKKIIVLFLFLSFQFFCFTIFGQSREIDSLKQLLISAQEDTNKVKVLNKIADKLWRTAIYDTSLIYANTAKALSVKLGFKKFTAFSLNIIGIVYMQQGNYPESLKNYFAALKIGDEIGDKKSIAALYNNIGIIYQNQENYIEAIQNYFAALKINNEMNNKAWQANNLGNIGLVYAFQHNYGEALKNHFASLKISKEIGSKKNIASSYNNIANVYAEQANIQTNPAQKQKLFNDALENYFSSLKLKEEIDDLDGITASYNNIAKVYIKKQMPDEALKMLQKSSKLAKEIGNLDNVKEAYYGLAAADSALGNYNESLINYKQYIIYRDSLNNEENTRKTVETQMQYEFDKKEAATKLEQEKRDVVSSAENKKQKIILIFVSFVLLFVVIFAVFVYRSYLQKQRSNIQITHQKHQIEEKQKEILDSINYASRIQKALLPSEAYINKNIKNKL